jgi:hypothetical protein
VKAGSRHTNHQKTNVRFWPKADIGSAGSFFQVVASKLYKKEKGQGGIPRPFIEKKKSLGSC